MKFFCMPGIEFDDAYRIHRALMLASIKWIWDRSS